MSEEELDAVSEYALRYQKFRLKQIKELLKSPPKDQEDKEALQALSNHDNLRGADYYE